MIDVRLFKNRLFRACSAAQFVGMIGFSASLFLLPIMLQAERGMSPFQSGLTTFPMAIGVMLMAQPTSRFYRIVGPRRLIAAGLIVASLTSFALAATDFETSQWTIRGLMLVRGFGFGLMLVPLQAATFATIASSDTGRASSLYSASRMVGQSLGVALIATVLTNRLAYHGAFLGSAAPAQIKDNALLAFRDGFIIAGVLTLIGMVVALFIKDRDAEATMRPRTKATTSAAPEEEQLALPGPLVRPNRAVCADDVTRLISTLSSAAGVRACSLQAPRPPPTARFPKRLSPDAD